MSQDETSDLTVHYEHGEHPDDRGTVQKINDTLNRELADPKAFNAIVATTFKGLDGTKAKQAMMEGMMRGHTFQDFLKKRVYAIPFGNGYQLVTSIEEARVKGMKNGVIGTSAPQYSLKADGSVESCEVTVKRLTHGIVGEFTALVFFDEYTKGRDLWKSKPKTMIAKVAEMHALRKACPEDLSGIYVEEEFDREAEIIQKPNTRMKDAKAASKSLTMGTYAKENSNQNQEPEAKGEEAQDHEGDTSGDNEQPPD